MSTRGFTFQELNDDDLKPNTIKNCSTIIEEDGDTTEREIEVRNNLEDVGPDDISSDDESSMSDEEENKKRDMELRDNLENIVGPNDLSSDDDEPGNTLNDNLNYNNGKYRHNQYSSESIGKHPFDDDINPEYFPQQVSLPESPTGLHINISHSQSSSADEHVLSNEVSRSLSNCVIGVPGINNRFDAFPANGLQYEYMHSGNDKERFQILYENRGREIDDLRAQLERVKRSNKTECEKLNSTLKLSRTEFERISCREKQLKELLGTYEGKVRSSNNDLIEKTETINNLKFANNTLITQLESANATISSLEQHVIEIKSVKGLARSKQMHDQFVQKLNNGHKEEIDEIEIKYKNSLSKIDSLNKEIVRLEYDLQSNKDCYSNALSNKELTIKSLQLSLKTIKPNTNAPNLDTLQARNKELEMELNFMQRKYESTKNNLDCCDLINKMRIYKDNVPAEDSMDLIKAIDFNNMSSVDQNELTEDLIPKAIDNNIKSIVEGLQKSVFCNKKLREETIRLQKLVSDKDNEIKHLRELRKQQENSNQNNCDDVIQPDTLTYLQHENGMLSKRIKEIEQEMQRENINLKKNTRAEIVQFKGNMDEENKKNSKPDEQDISASLIGYYQEELEKEKLKRDELELYYENQIKELTEKLSSMASTTSIAPTFEGYQAELIGLRIKIDTYTKQIERIESEKQKLIDDYENDIRNITDTLMDKEGEIQETKSNLKTQVSCFNTVICELNMNHTKLSKKNENLNKQISNAKEFFKQKLSDYREKYQNQQASFAKYKNKADERIDYYFKEVQRVAKGMETANNKTVDEIRSWLNSSRENIIKKIDTMCFKLKKSPVSHELTKHHLTALLELKDIVLHLNVKDSESYFLYFN